MAQVPFDPGQSTQTQAQRSQKIREAMDWLQVAMAGRTRPAAEVEAEALAAGIARTTLTTARQRLLIRSKRRGQAWVWIPPKSRKKQPVPS